MVEYRGYLIGPMMSYFWITDHQGSLIETAEDESDAKAIIDGWQNAA